MITLKANCPECGKLYEREVPEDIVACHFVCKCKATCTECDQMPNREDYDICPHIPIEETTAKYIDIKAFR